MKLLYEYLLLLIIHRFIHAEEAEQHGKLHYKSDSVPTYSRRTPYQDEGEFPEPVFGIAHGHPYNREKSGGDKEDKGRIPPGRQERREDSSGKHDVAGSDHRFPPKYIHDAEEAIEKNIPRNHRVKLRPSLHFVRSGDADASSSADDSGRSTREPLEWGQEGDYGPVSHGTTAESGEERSDRRQRPEPDSSPEDYEEVRPRPQPPRIRRPHQHHPNERGLRGNGDGSDSERTDGKYYEDSGERSRERKPPNKGRRGPGSSPGQGKIVGVDMQLVAGVYPRRWKTRDSGRAEPGRFSPLSGPYPERGERGEGRKSYPDEWINGNKHEPRERHGDSSHSPAGKDISRAEEPSPSDRTTPDAGSDGPPPQRSRYGQFDGYFQRPEASSEQGPEGSDQHPRQYGSHEQPTETTRTQEAPHHENTAVAVVTPVVTKDEERAPVFHGDVDPKPGTENPLSPDEDSCKEELANTGKKERPEETGARNPGEEFKGDIYSNQDQNPPNERRPLAFGSKSNTANVTETPSLLERTRLPVPGTSILPTRGPLEIITTSAANFSNFRDLRENGRVDSGGGTRPRDPPPTPPPTNVTTTLFWTTTGYSSSSPVSNLSLPPPVSSNHTM
ncbi:hypothetical protein Aduo_014401 [Ancylostoma duodenale]